MRADRFSSSSSHNTFAARLKRGHRTLASALLGLAGVATGASLGCASLQRSGDDLASACESTPNGYRCEATTEFCRELLTDEDRTCDPGLAVSCENTGELVRSACSCTETGSWSCQAAPRGLAMQLWDGLGPQDQGGGTLSTVAVLGQGQPTVIIDGSDAPMHTLSGRQVRFVAVPHCPGAPPPTVAALFGSNERVDEARALFVADESACLNQNDALAQASAACPIEGLGIKPHLFTPNSRLEDFALLSSIPGAFASMRQTFSMHGVLAVPSTSIARASTQGRGFEVQPPFMQCRASDGTQQFAWLDNYCVRGPGDFVAGPPQAFVLPDGSTSASELRLVPRMPSLCEDAREQGLAAWEETDAVLARCEGPLPSGQWQPLELWKQPEDVIGSGAAAQSAQWAFLGDQAVALPPSSLSHAKRGGGLLFAEPETACLDDDGRIRITWRSEAHTKFADASCQDLRARVDVGVMFRVPAGADVLGLPLVTERTEQSCRFRDPVWRCPADKPDACRPLGAGDESEPATPATP